MKIEQDNQPPPDAFGTDYRAQQLQAAVLELLKCPWEDFTPIILLDVRLSTSVLLGLLSRLDGKQ